MIKTDNPEKLPGYIKRSFSMFFGGGEIWFEHLDGIYIYEDLVLKKLNEDSKSFSRPSKPSLICFNLDDTQITENIISTIADKLMNTEKVFTRVCFVGTDRKSRKAINKILTGRKFALDFIDDFEKAKEWLVSEQR